MSIAFALFIVVASYGSDVRVNPHKPVWRLSAGASPKLIPPLPLLYTPQKLHILVAGHDTMVWAQLVRSTLWLLGQAGVGVRNTPNRRVGRWALRLLGTGTVRGDLRRIRSNLGSRKA